MSSDYLTRLAESRYQREQANPPKDGARWLSLPFALNGGYPRQSDRDALFVALRRSSELRLALCDKQGRLKGYFHDSEGRCGRLRLTPEQAGVLYEVMREYGTHIPANLRHLAITVGWLDAGQAEWLSSSANSLHNE